MAKLAIKLVDRLLSHDAHDIDHPVHWVPYVVGSRARINVSMDWIEFDADGHAATMLALLIRLLKRRRFLSLALMEIYR